MSMPPFDEQLARSAVTPGLRGRFEGGVDRFIPRGLRRHREPFLYLVVGGWNTLFGYGVFVVLYRLAGAELSYAVILTASYGLAILNAYLAYRYVAFRSHGAVRRELPRFAVVYLLTLIVNLVFFPIALDVLPVSAYAVQAVFTVGVVVASYVAHKYFSFRLSSVGPAVLARDGHGNDPLDVSEPKQPASGGR
jgi:putative flippase GtrA